MGAASLRSALLESFITDVDRLAETRRFGRVTSILGMLLEIGGVQEALSIGDRCTVHARGGRLVNCEVVGFRNDRALAMPFGALRRRAESARGRGGSVRAARGTRRDPRPRVP